MSSSKKESPVRKRHVRKDNNNNNNNNNSVAENNSKQQTAGRDIRRGIQEQQRQEAAQHKRISRIQQQSHASLQKFYFVIIINLLMIIMGGILYLKPEFFFGHPPPKREWPPRHLALLYPPNVSPLHDLPPFFESYSIATDENRATRQAWRYLLTMRKKLKPYSILLTGWEREELWNYPMDRHCGTGFQKSYKEAVAKGSIRYSEDLILWCLLRTYQNDGFLQWNITLYGAPTSTAISEVHDDHPIRVKGLAVKYVTQNRIHPSILWVPKKKEIHLVNTTENSHTNNDEETTTTTRTRYDMDTEIPSKMLKWLMLEASLINTLEYPKAAEEYVYRLMQDEPDRWLFLSVICDDDSGEAVLEEQKQQLANSRIIARECPSMDSCCTVYMPEELDDYRNKRQLRNRREEEHSSSVDNKD